EGDHREHAPAGAADAVRDLGKAVIAGKRQRQRQAGESAERKRQLHRAMPAATLGAAPAVLPPARNALKRRATSSGVTVGRPSLPIEPGAMRAWIKAGL